MRGFEIFPIFRRGNCVIQLCDVLESREVHSGAKAFFDLSYPSTDSKVFHRCTIDVVTGTEHVLGHAQIIRSPQSNTVSMSRKRSLRKLSLNMIKKSGGRRRMVAKTGQDIPSYATKR